MRRLYLLFVITILAVVLIAVACAPPTEFITTNSSQTTGAFSAECFDHNGAVVWSGTGSNAYYNSDGLWTITTNGKDVKYSGDCLIVPS